MIVAAAAEYRSKVELAGLSFRPVRPSFDDLQRALGMDRARATAAMLSGGAFLFRRLIMPHVRMAYEDMAPLLVDADMAVTSSLAFGARLAAERGSTPWIGVVLQPLMFLSAFDPPEIPGVPGLGALLRRMGPGPTRWALRMLAGAVGPLLRPVHALRAEIGLPPSGRNPLFEGQFGAAGAIGLYSTVFGAIRADYPRPTAITGFAWFDSVDGADRPLAPALQEFLDAGPRPLVFTLGSLVVNSPGAFYRESVAAARLLGRRAVLLVGDEGLESCAVHRCDDVHVSAYAPHSLLFPRAEAIVHQGGIGTLGQAMRAGWPQLIVPFFADQMDNASRAKRLGVARVLPPGRYRAAAAAHELRILSTNAAYGATAAQLEGRLRGEDGAAQAARIVLDRIESPLPKNGDLRCATITGSF